MTSTVDTDKTTNNAIECTLCNITDISGQPIRFNLVIKTRIV